MNLFLINYLYKSDIQNRDPTNIYEFFGFNNLHSRILDSNFVMPIFGLLASFTLSHSNVMITIGSCLKQQHTPKFI